jgi:hypothetical protein
MLGSSLLLSWENPVDLFVPTVRSATLFRRLHAIGSVVVKEDITWGMTIDTENADETAEYIIIYYGPFGESLYTINNDQIIRYPTPSTICRVDMAFIRPDGSPDTGRMVEFSDENSEIGEFTRRILTNTRGKSAFYCMPNSKLLIRIDGRANAYDVIIPDQRSIKFEDLISKFGTAVPVDPRRYIGFN